jgi:hydrogenase 3 maturation protease
MGLTSYLEKRRMSQESWQEQLCQTVKNLQASKDQPRVAVVGIGHELRGDDAAGLHVTRRLNGHGRHPPAVLIVEAGAAPENCCGLICRHKPDLVLFADAADMAAEAGTIRWLPWQATAGFNTSTHTVPLQLLSGYLTSRLDCQVALLGIQPADLSLDAPLSAAVDRAVWLVVQGLAKLLLTPEGAASI